MFILYVVFGNPDVLVSTRSCVICIKGLGPGGCPMFQIRCNEVLVVRLCTCGTERGVFLLY